MLRTVNLQKREELSKFAHGGLNDSFVILSKLDISTRRDKHVTVSNDTNICKIGESRLSMHYPCFGGWSRLSGRVGGQTYNVTWSCKGVKCWSRRTGTSWRYTDVSVKMRLCTTEDFHYHSYVQF